MLYCFVSSTARTARSIVRILRVASSPLLVEKYQVPIDVLGVGSEAYRVGQKSVASIMVDGNGAPDVRRRIGKQVAVRLGQRPMSALATARSSRASSSLQHYSDWRRLLVFLPSTPHRVAPGPIARAPGRCALPRLDESPDRPGIRAPPPRIHHRREARCLD